MSRIDSLRTDIQNKINELAQRSPADLPLPSSVAEVIFETLRDSSPDDVKIKRVDAEELAIVIEYVNKASVEVTVQGETTPQTRQLGLETRKGLLKTTIDNLLHYEFIDRYQESGDRWIPMTRDYALKLQRMLAEQIDLTGSGAGIDAEEKKVIESVILDDSGNPQTWTDVWVSTHGMSVLLQMVGRTEADIANPDRSVTGRSTPKWTSPEAASSPMLELGKRFQQEVMRDQVVRGGGEAAKQRVWEIYAGFANRLADPKASENDRALKVPAYDNLMAVARAVPYNELIFADTDGDRFSDGWEQAHGTDPFSTQNRFQPVMKPTIGSYAPRFGSDNTATQLGDKLSELGRREGGAIKSAMDAYARDTYRPYFDYLRDTNAPRGFYVPSSVNESTAYSTSGVRFFENMLPSLTSNYAHRNLPVVPGFDMAVDFVNQTGGRYVQVDGSVELRARLPKESGEGELVQEGGVIKDGEDVAFRADDLNLRAHYDVVTRHEVSFYTEQGRELRVLAQDIKEIKINEDGKATIEVDGKAVVYDASGLTVSRGNLVGVTLAQEPQGGERSTSNGSTIIRATEGAPLQGAPRQYLDPYLSKPGGERVEFKNAVVHFVRGGQILGSGQANQRWDRVPGACNSRAETEQNSRMLGLGKAARDVTLTLSDGSPMTFTKDEINQFAGIIAYHMLPQADEVGFRHNNLPDRLRLRSGQNRDGKILNDLDFRGEDGKYWTSRDDLWLKPGYNWTPRGAIAFGNASSPQLINISDITRIEMKDGKATIFKRSDIIRYEAEDGSTQSVNSVDLVRVKVDQRSNATLFVKSATLAFQIGDDGLWTQIARVFDRGLQTKKTIALRDITKIEITADATATLHLRNGDPVTGVKFSSELIGGKLTENSDGSKVYDNADGSLRAITEIPNARLKGQLNGGKRSRDGDFQIFENDGTLGSEEKIEGKKLLHEPTGGQRSEANGVTTITNDGSLEGIVAVKIESTGRVELHEVDNVGFLLRERDDDVAFSDYLAFLRRNDGRPYARDGATGGGVAFSDAQALGIKEVDLAADKTQLKGFFKSYDLNKEPHLRNKIVAYSVYGNDPGRPTQVAAGWVMFDSNNNPIDSGWFSGVFDHAKAKADKIDWNLRNAWFPSLNDSKVKELFLKLIVSSRENPETDRFVTTQIGGNWRQYLVPQPEPPAENPAPSSG